MEGKIPPVWDRVRFKGSISIISMFFDPNLSYDNLQKETSLILINQFRDGEGEGSNNYLIAL